MMMKVKLEITGQKVHEVVHAFGMDVIKGKPGDQTLVVQIMDEDMEHITDQIEQWQVRWKVVR